MTENNTLKLVISVETIKLVYFLNFIIRWKNELKKNLRIQY